MSSWSNIRVCFICITLPPSIMEVENGALEDEFSLKQAIFHFHVMKKINDFVSLNKGVHVDNRQELGKNAPNPYTLRD